MSCKIRLLPSIDDTVALAKMLERSGCAILTVHGRDKESIAQRVGPCNFDAIQRIKYVLTSSVDYYGFAFA